jgi:glycyl-tRNA synthetase beta chain
MQANLLVELGTEELPPKSLTMLASAFCNGLASLLTNNHFTFESSQWYATPRRLAVKINGLQAQQPDQLVEKRGPAIKAAYDDQGNPTKAALGWARGNNIDISQADILKTDKGEWLLHKAQVTGQHIATLLPDFINKALSQLPIPKPMRWGSSAHQFIRPVHSFTMLLGDQVIAGEVLGLQSDRRIQGHRFHGEPWLTLADADSYLETLNNSFVIADFEARKNSIWQQICEQAEKIQGVVEKDEALLEEVSSLVEWPVALVAEFDSSFLEVPKEALIYTMKDDQKYFPVLDQQHQLSNKFIFIANIASKDPKQVIRGNERVIRPRLADAQFFYEADRKQRLDARLADLEKITFQAKLGSVKDKCERIAQIASDIASKIGSDPKLAARAGLLSKTDLTTQVVMEFPDVQGVMGMYYARLDGEVEEVALALKEQYMPRFSGDNLPQSHTSRAVALADKLDTLVGIFGIGMLPKGDKDPYALRRAAIGLLRIIADAKLPLDLKDLINLALHAYGDKITNKDTADQVLEFVLSRVRTLYQEQGIDVDVIQAVFVNKPTCPADFDARLEGVNQFKQLPAAARLAAANKRVANILQKNVSGELPHWQTDLFVQSEEKQLAKALQLSQQKTQSLVNEGKYAQVLKVLSGLADDIDAFFDQVMVMTEDEAVKNNRLALLADLRDQFMQVADISELS